MQFLIPIFIIMQILSTFVKTIGSVEIPKWFKYGVLFAIIVWLVDTAKRNKLKDEALKSGDLIASICARLNQAIHQFGNSFSFLPSPLEPSDDTEIIAIGKDIANEEMFSSVVERYKSEFDLDLKKELNEALSPSELKEFYANFGKATVNTTGSVTKEIAKTAPPVIFTPIGVLPNPVAIAQFFGLLGKPNAPAANKTIILTRKSIPSNLAGKSLYVKATNLNIRDFKNPKSVVDGLVKGNYVGKIKAQYYLTANGVTGIKAGLYYEVYYGSKYIFTNKPVLVFCEYVEVK